MTFTSLEICALYSCIIDRELSTLSSHEVIVCDLANLHETIGEIETSSEVTGWSVKAIEDETMKETCKE